MAETLADDGEKLLEDRLVRLPDDPHRNRYLRDELKQPLAQSGAVHVVAADQRLPHSSMQGHQFADARETACGRLVIGLRQAVEDQLFQPPRQIMFDEVFVNLGHTLVPPAGGKKADAEGRLMPPVAAAAFPDPGLNANN
ncbi:MAG: hypothetical protein JO366_07160 [Methylobacteriaceae bacterium]|nr:hypothetical protein [Methylobacteriaceae bacterium]